MPNEMVRVTLAGHSSHTLCTEPKHRNHPGLALADNVCVAANVNRLSLESALEFWLVRNAFDVFLARQPPGKVRNSAVQAWEKIMIHLTRLNNQALIVNADLIKFIENAPDTVITLLTGEKLVVRETVDEVLQRIGQFHERFYRRAGPGIAFDTSLALDASSNRQSRESAEQQDSQA
jgi:flagellar protein FlbD